jgi:GNAT superfamily N-acetyltransferase
VTIRVRRVDAGREDVAACIMALQAEIFPVDDPRDLVGDVWWLAFNDRKVIGFAALRLLPTDEGLAAYLSRCGVRAGSRGKGVQRRLIRARLCYARKAGAVVAISDTTANPPSANSLIAEGFRVYDPAYPWAMEDSTYWIKTL